MTAIVWTALITATATVTASLGAVLINAYYGNKALWGSRTRPLVLTWVSMRLARTR
jgi:hypothetical protein